MNKIYKDFFFFKLLLKNTVLKDNIYFLLTVDARLERTEASYKLTELSFLQQLGTKSNKRRGDLGNGIDFEHFNQKFQFTQSKISISPIKSFKFSNQKALVI